MPAKSRSQQRLFGMAYAVRIGELNRSKVSKEVLDIVDGDMSTSKIKAFTKYKSIVEFLNEQLNN